MFHVSGKSMVVSGKQNKSKADDAELQSRAGPRSGASRREPVALSHSQGFPLLIPDQKRSFPLLSFPSQLLGGESLLKAQNNRTS